MTLRVGDLFAGIGGFSLAAEWVGWQTAWFSEIEPYPCAVLKKHWPNVPNHGDITKIKGSEVEPVDVLCGGFPCQDISLAGKGAGIDGERSGLWAHYARLIDEIRPSFVVAENVSALKSRGLDRVLWDLWKIGYDAEWHCIPASAVGAPHQRDRIWVMAYPEGFGERAGLRPGESASERWGRFGDGSFSDALADTEGVRRRKEHQDTGGSQERSNPEGANGGGPSFSGSCGALDNPERQRLQRHPGHVSRSEGWPRKIGSIAAASFCSREAPRDAERWWAAEPDVGRVGYGIPAVVDRLKSLGNALVPVVAYEFFRVIDAMRTAVTLEDAA